MGITTHASSPHILHAFSDAHWLRNKYDYISTTAHVIYIGKNPVSWSSRKHAITA